MLVKSKFANLKITRSEDLIVVEQILSDRKIPISIKESQDD